MRIEAVGQKAVAPPEPRQTGPGQSVAHARKAGSPQSDPAPPAASKPRGEGVVRLLQEGHFKGVADVRLRINFFDELSKHAAAEADSNLESGARDLVGLIESEMRALLDKIEVNDETREAVDDLVQEFEDAVAASATAFTDGDLDRAGLADALNAAFATLVDQLRHLLAPPVEPPEPEEAPSESAPVGDGTAADESDETEVADPDVTGEAEADPVPGQETPDNGGEEIVFDLEEALAAIREAFDDALAGLFESSNTSAHLPPLSSEPSGNGRAYAKFLAIYNELVNQLSGGGPHEEPPESTTDLTA